MKLSSDASRHAARHLLPRRIRSVMHELRGGFIAGVGDEYTHYLRQFCGLRPHHRILDIGCGTGRMAVPLSRYLRSGSYIGIDTQRWAIWFSRMRVLLRQKNAHFQHIDVQNGLYAPKKKGQVSPFRLPFHDGSFDCVLLASVFTHMLPETIDSYVREIERILVPGGACLATFFVMNEEALRYTTEGKSSQPFVSWRNAYAVDRDCPERAVAYPPETIRLLCEQGCLKMEEPIRWGFWCGRQSGVSYQDLVILRKKEV